MAAFKHWRISGWQQDENDSMYWSQANLLDLKGELVSAPADIVSESYNDGGAFTDSIFDGSSSTFKQLNVSNDNHLGGRDNPFQATIELTEPVEVGYLQVEVRDLSDANRPEYYGFKIEYSADGLNWQIYGYWAEGTLGLQMDEPKTLVAQLSDISRAPRRRTFAGNGGIFGIVTEDGAPVSGRNVYLYERETFNKFRQTQSDEIGGYQFFGINEDLEWMLLCVDTDGANPKNAIIHDRIVPISLLSGSEQDNAFVASRITRADVAGLYLPQQYGFARTYNGDNMPNPWETDNANSAAQPPDISSQNPLVFFWGPGDRGAGHHRGAGLLLAGGSESSPPHDSFSGEVIFRSTTTGEDAELVIDGESSNDFYRDNAHCGLIFVVGSDEILITAYTENISDITPKLATHPEAVIGSIPILPLTQYHMAFSYTQGLELRVVLNGSNVHTFSLSGRGRLVNSRADAGNGDSEADRERQTFTKMRAMYWMRTWWRDSSVDNSASGLIPDSISANNAPDPSFRGGPMALYNTDLTQVELEALYDAYVNPQLPVYSAHEAVFLRDMPTLWFRLNDADGAQPVASRVCTSITASYTTTGVTYSEPGIVPGETGVVFGNSGSLRTNSSIFQGDFFSFECFFRLNQLPGSQARLWTWENGGGSDAMYLYVSGNGELIMGVHDGSSWHVYATPAATVFANTDYHLVCRHDSSVEFAVQFYLNNSLVLDQSAIYRMRNDARGFTIGANGAGASPGNNLNGLMQDFLWYPYYLPAERIQAHYDYWQNA